MSLGWSIAHTRLRCTSVPKDCFILANSADPDEMLCSVLFHLGLHCLGKHPFRALIQRVKRYNSWIEVYFEI